MLYDPKWGKQTETKADPFALATLIAWLELQPADKSYNFADCDGACLIDLYLGKNTTFREYRAVPETFRVDVAAQIPWTFGAALERARAIAR